MQTGVDPKFTADETAVGLPVLCFSEAVPGCPGGRQKDEVEDVVVCAGQRPDREG